MIKTILKEQIIMKTSNCISTVLLTAALSISSIHASPLQTPPQNESLQKTAGTIDKSPDQQQPPEHGGAMRDEKRFDGTPGNCPPPPQYGFNGGSHRCGPDMESRECKSMPGDEKGMRNHDNPPLSHGIPFLPGLFLPILLSVIFIVNILLTVIITLDMAKKELFNGIWIPLVLLAGLPGAVVYALFRLGDRISLRA
jgi:hypothetical protein